MGKWPAKMREHSADQNTNDDRDLAKKRQSKKLFLSQKTLGCLKLLKCTYTVTVIQASYRPHGIFYIFHIYIFCWIWTLWRMEDVSVQVVRSVYYFTALMRFWTDILADSNFQNKTFAKTRQRILWSGLCCQSAVFFFFSSCSQHHPTGSAACSLTS